MIYLHLVVSCNFNFYNIIFFTSYLFHMKIWLNCYIYWIFLNLIWNNLLIGINFQLEIKKRAFIIYFIYTYRLNLIQIKNKNTTLFLILETFDSKYKHNNKNRTIFFQKNTLINQVNKHHLKFNKLYLITIYINTMFVCRVIIFNKNFN